MRPIRPLLTALLALALAACTPAPYADVRGPGFDTPEQAAARRDAMLAGASPLQPFPTEAEAIAADARAALGQPGAGSVFPPPFDPVGAPGPVTPVAVATLDLDRDNPSISREQDFAAVSAERDIAADAERLRVAREQYQVVAPTTLERPADVGPNIFAYALGRARPLGSAGAYGRGLAATRGAPKCATYASPDLAQEAFLAAGGPERDRLGLDPDGDGNACGWDPATVRNAVAR